jgi:hypothetical protein
MERDRQKMSTDHLYKSMVEESNCDVTSGLPRPLVPDIISGRNLEKPKTLKNSQTVADRRVQHTDTKNYFRSIYRIAILFTMSGATYCRFPLPIRFCQNEKALIKKR